MPLLGAAELTSAIAALGGVDVTIGASTVKGLVRAPDREAFGDDGSDLIGRSKSVLIVTGALAGLTDGASITVGGEAMKVLRFAAEYDGSVTRIYCRKS